MERSTNYGGYLWLDSVHTTKSHFHNCQQKQQIYFLPLYNMTGYVIITITIRRYQVVLHSLLHCSRLYLHVCQFHWGRQEIFSLFFWGFVHRSVHSWVGAPGIAYINKWVNSLRSKQVYLIRKGWQSQESADLQVENIFILMEKRLAQRELAAGREVGVRVPCVIVDGEAGAGKGKGKGW